MSASGYVRVTEQHPDDQGTRTGEPCPCPSYLCCLGREVGRFRTQGLGNHMLTAPKMQREVIIPTRSPSMSCGRRYAALISLMTPLFAIKRKWNSRKSNEAYFAYFARKEGLCAKVLLLRLNRGLTDLPSLLSSRFSSVFRMMTTIVRLSPRSGASRCSRPVTP